MMEGQLFDYHGACDDLRQMIDRAHAAARSGLIEHNQIYRFAEELITTWQQFYALS